MDLGAEKRENEKRRRATRTGLLFELGRAHESVKALDNWREKAPPARHRAPAPSPFSSRAPNNCDLAGLAGVPIRKMRAPAGPVCVYQLGKTRENKQTSRQTGA